MVQVDLGETISMGGDNRHRSLWAYLSISRGILFDV